jgi:hypothetical protein
MSARLTRRMWPTARARVYVMLLLVPTLLVPTGVVLTYSPPTHAAPTDGPRAPGRIVASFRPDRLGAMGALTVTIDLAEVEMNGASPLRHFVLRLPAGLGVEIPQLRSCEPGRLQMLGARGCSAQSRLGVGQALVQAQLGSQSLGESISLWVFLGPLSNLQPTFEILAQGYTPFDERLVFSGTVLPDKPPYGEDLVLPIPSIATLPLEPSASIASMSLTIGSHQRSAREPNETIEPTRCPLGGFPFDAELSYADGSTQNVSTATSCPGSTIRK